MKVPLLDLKKQYEQIEEDVVESIQDVLRSQHFILGPKVEELERRVAEYCQCEYAVGVSSGTDALMISLMTGGVGAGDLVITTPYTFFATAGSIARLGARPVFVDIEASTYNMDPNELDAVISGLEREQRSRLRAIIPVHLFGQTADMKPIMEIAESLRLDVIEDAAQAIGAEYDWDVETVKRAGSMGKYGCFSFFPSKNLGACGDAGMVTTNARDIYDKLRIMRGHGAQPKYYHSFIGGNFRLDALQAAVLLVKLRYLDEWTFRRRKNAELYRKAFEDSGVEGIILPEEKQRRHIYNQFVIKVEEARDELKEYLNEQGVGCEVYYPVPLHMQACFEQLGYRASDFPVSLEASETTLALPVYPELTDDQIYYVVDRVTEFVAQMRKGSLNTRKMA